ELASLTKSGAHGFTDRGDKIRFNKLPDEWEIGEVNYSRVPIKFIRLKVGATYVYGLNALLQPKQAGDTMAYLEYDCVTGYVLAFMIARDYYNRERSDKAIYNGPVKDLSPAADALPTGPVNPKAKLGGNDTPYILSVVSQTITKGDNIFPGMLFNNVTRAENQ